MNWVLLLLPAPIFLMAQAQSSVQIIFNSSSQKKEKISKKNAERAKFTLYIRRVSICRWRSDIELTYMLAWKRAAAIDKVSCMYPMRIMEMFQMCLPHSPKRENLMDIMNIKWQGVKRPTIILGCCLCVDCGILWMHWTLKAHKGTSLND